MRINLLRKVYFLFRLRTRMASAKIFAVTRAVNHELQNETASQSTCRKINAKLTIVA